MDDDAIRTLLRRLARAHPSGGTVIERAAIVAEGSGSDDVIKWMVAHGAEAEATPPPKERHGLHESGWRAIDAAKPSTPSRYILPPGALD